MAFDPQQFLNTTMTEATSTEYVPIPVGDYPAICTKADIRSAQNKESGDRYYFFETSWEIDDQRVRDELGQDHPTARYSIGLDINEETGQLATGKGKNVRYGRAREAIGKNNPNEDFAPSMFKGQMALVSVKHRLGDGGEVYSEVKSIAPMTKSV